jgi:hypothetical protein
MSNPDIDKEDMKEVQEIVRKLYKRFGANAKLIFFLAGALGDDADHLADLWEKSNKTFTDALNSDGVFRG